MDSNLCRVDTDVQLFYIDIWMYFVVCYTKVMMIYTGQIIGVFASIGIQFMCYDHFGPFATIAGFLLGCFVGYILHIQKNPMDRNRNFRWKISKRTFLVWSSLFFIGYGLYVVLERNVEWEYLFILPILSLFLGGGSGILAAIVGDCIPLIYKDEESQ